MSTALSMHLTPGAHGWSGVSVLTLWYFTHWLFWILVNIPCLCRGFREAWEKPPCESKEKSWQGSGGQRQPVTVGHQRGKGRSPVGASRCAPSVGPEMA